jgi:hypothetical protein
LQTSIGTATVCAMAPLENPTRRRCTNVGAETNVRKVKMITSL